MAVSPLAHCTPGPTGFTTARTLLRPFTLADAPVAFAWLSDPQVMHFAAHGPDSSLAITEARIHRYMAHQERFGFARWLVLDRATSTPCGDAGLMWLEASQVFELGYRFHSACWGRGLATEVAAAWIDYAWATIKLDRFIAFADRRNAASLAVIRKLGLHYLHDAFLEGLDAAVFEAVNPALRAALAQPSLPTQS